MRVAVPLLLAFALAPSAAALGLPWTWHDALLIDTGSAGAAKRLEAFDASSLNLADIDRDGDLEIVSLNDNNRAYVLDSRSGHALAELDTTRPGGEAWPARDINAIAIGDLRGDGRPCLVVPNSAAYVAAWCYQGAGLFGRTLRFEKLWEVRADASLYEKDFAARHPWLGKDAAPGMDGNAFLAEVDGDAGLEVFFASDGYPGQFSFDGGDGRYRWSRSDWDGNAGAQVADLDGDGAKEAVFASDAGVVACFDAKTGKLEWTFDARKAGAMPGSIPVAPTLADLTGDGKLDAFFGARHAVEGPGDWRNASHATYFLLDHAGKEVWRASAPWMNPLTYTRAAALDVDGDGDRDVLTLDWNTVGHKPGNWEPTGRPANLFALDGKTGALLWRQGLDVFWSNKDLVVADITGDRGLEVVVDEADASGRDGLGVRDLRTGERVAWHALPAGWQAMRGPVAGDLYGDGRVMLVVPLARADASPNYRALDVGHREGALLVIDTGSRGEVAWSANMLNAEGGMGGGAAMTIARGAAVAGAVAVGVALGVTARRKTPRRS